MRKNQGWPLSRKGYFFSLLLLSLSFGACGSNRQPYEFEKHPQSSRLTTQDLNGIHGSGLADIWVVGNAGTILHLNDKDGSLVPTGDPTFNVNFYGVWSTGSNRVWIAGGAGLVLEYDGTKWIKHPSLGGSSSVTFKGVWASSPNDIWVVGTQGTILRYGAGGIATQLPSNTMVSLNAVWGKNANEVWIVGDQGTILFFDGTSLKTIASSPTGGNNYTVWGANPSKPYAWVGGEYGMYSFNSAGMLLGGGFGIQGPSGPVTGVWTRSTGDVGAFIGPTIPVIQIGATTIFPTPTNAEIAAYALNKVWGTGDNVSNDKFFVIGKGGSIVWRPLAE